jgi:hypothetical protein
MFGVGAEYLAISGFRTLQTVENMSAVAMWAGLGVDVDDGAFGRGAYFLHTHQNFTCEVGSV